MPRTMGWRKTIPVSGLTFGLTFLPANYVTPGGGVRHRRSELLESPAFRRFAFCPTPEWGRGVVD